MAKTNNSKYNSKNHATQHKRSNLPKDKWKKQKGKAEHQKPNKQQLKKIMKAQKKAEESKERQRAKEEKEERIRIYKKKRLEKTKVLSKKTHRGQPLMKDRLTMLLKEIEEMKKK